MKSITISIFLVMIIFAHHFLQAQTSWKESSYEDFVDGSFDDAGANWYVSHQGRIQMINRWDVNNDGHVDILCANSHPLVEMLDMSIYWGNGKDFSIKNHSYVPANGPMWAAPGDLDNDGEMDLVVANYSNGTWTEMPSFVYYGGLKNKNYKRKSEEWAFYPFKKRIELPSSSAQKPAIGDFNRDGYIDVVFAFSGGFWEYRAKNKAGVSPSRIYWGGQTGFDEKRFTNVMTAGATDVAVADLNGDAWPDLVFSNGSGPESFLYYGSKKGYGEENLTKLPTNKPHAVEIGDINNDGLSDIVFANEAGYKSYAYLNKGGSFDPDHRLEFETYAAKDVVVADFNNDKYADVFFSNHQHSLSGDPKKANRLINSFIYFGTSDGFEDSNRQAIETIGAWGANAADLNQDGWIDLLICNFQEHYSYEVPSFIYWNGSDGFHRTKRTPLYEHGAQGNAIADLNGDGHLDILITSMMGNSRGDYDLNYLYFGKDDGQYSTSNRIELPGREAYEQAFTDLDDDGQVDVLLLNRGEVTREANELWAYWNNNNKFDPWRITGMASFAALGVEVADLDRNGFLDVIISNSKTYKPESANPGSFIYWGESEGWPVPARTSLPIVQTRSTAVCDINGDGFLDLVFGQQGKWGEASIFYGDGSREFAEERRERIEGSEGSGTPGVADLNKDGLLDIAFAHDKNVLIYYQIENGKFSSKKSETIPVMAKTMCVADVNGDEWLDLICPFYKGNGKRSWYSTILLGSKDGYTLNNSIKLPTDGATGSIVSDFNRDGFEDIFFFCHRHDGSYNEVGKFGDHHTNSVIFWGTKNGFEEENKLEIPTVGVHYDMGIDIGHIQDRSFVYTYTSSAYQIGNKSPQQIEWRGETPNRSSIKFQLRSAENKNDLELAEWTGPEGKNTYYETSGQGIKNLARAEWVQYQAVFETENGAYSPVLTHVEISFK